MTTLAQNQTTPRTMQQMLGFLPMLIVVLFLASLPLLKIDHRSGSPDIGHVQIVMAKKNAWLMQHPLLLKVSQMNFAGVSGEFMTSTCWHLVRNVSHRQQP